MSFDIFPFNRTVKKAVAMLTMKTLLTLWILMNILMVMVREMMKVIMNERDDEDDDEGDGERDDDLLQGEVLVLVHWWQQWSRSATRKM